MQATQVLTLWIQRYATEVIHECSEAWKKLIAGQGDHKNVGIAM
jgi:hypothetical protein